MGRIVNGLSRAGAPISGRNGPYSGLRFRRHEDDAFEGLEIVVLHPFVERAAVHFRYALIAQDRIKGGSADALEPVPTIRCGLYVVAVHAEHVGEGLSDLTFVVDHEHAGAAHS